MTGLPDYLEELWLKHNGSRGLDDHAELRIFPEDLISLCEEIALKAAASGVMLAKQQMLLSLDRLNQPLGETSHDRQSSTTNH